MIGLATLLPVLFGTAFAHMQMYDPPPMGSKAAPVKDSEGIRHVPQVQYSASVSIKRQG